MRGREMVELPLTDRMKEVLKLVIENYNLTAEPVSSLTLSRTSHLNLSSATIRNIMAELEEMGLLVQPHTSAGRVPTEKGYRFYVCLLYTSPSPRDS